MARTPSRQRSEGDGQAVQKLAVKHGYALKETLVNRYVLESDLLINVPVAKSHGSAMLTFGPTGGAASTFSAAHRRFLIQVGAPGASSAAGACWAL